MKHTDKDGYSFCSDWRWDKAADKPAKSLELYDINTRSLTLSTQMIANLLHQHGLELPEPEPIPEPWEPKAGDRIELHDQPVHDQPDGEWEAGYTVQFVTKTQFAYTSDEDTLIYVARIPVQSYVRLAVESEPESESEPEPEPWEPKVGDKIEALLDGVWVRNITIARVWLGRVYYKTPFYGRHYDNKIGDPGIRLAEPEPESEPESEPEAEPWVPKEGEEIEVWELGGWVLGKTVRYVSETAIAYTDRGNSWIKVVAIGSKNARPSRSAL